MGNAIDTPAKFSPEQLNQIARKLRPGRQKLEAQARPAVLKPSRVRFDPAKHGNFSLSVRTAGLLDTLHFLQTERLQCQPDEVEIEVAAAGINFRDVMIGLGIYPTPEGSHPSMGGEVAGWVTAIGADVTNFKIGDEVMGAVGEGFQAYVTVQVERVIHKPAGLSLDYAAGVPVVFLTCIYGLIHLANLTKGERILIHSAAGGVGLSAIQIAQWIGAEIFATVGTPDKRELLRSLEIQHIMDSHSLSFAEEVLQITNGEGVDVVLNSLAGEAIEKGLECLRPYGRFIELGKRDLMENRPLGLRPFSRGLSFTGVELSWLQQMRPGLMGRMLQQISDLFSQHVLRPLPTTFYPIAEVGKAFSSMTRGTHVGKIVLLVKGQEVYLE
jgi:NADPH:quinone reductase-like Zn-dependent oxidoreductase